ncbi:leucine-rich repeat neuronal protein 2-like [Conger conger]|uniref:leucine-rich repeat neuronal protein 2-like n=1 Tax=Conger conger TaxID=82655 RepID=UPI002A5AE4DA|nr:leucine-rich repeat neuronal protein 2-like [Conger conger]XP_061112676.1 leucine-rich repeat neuronal protein 2-like [Conger conger]XP_061112677.1 leucine-rich repeat neuronal protein 2-like [Conger conger]
MKPSGMALLLRLPLLLGVASALVIHSVPWRVPCPAQCVCQIRPWYSPQSVYREAPTVDCSDLLLSQLPPLIPRETHTLRLQSNLLSSLDQSELQDLGNLTELDLSQNSFSSTRHLRVDAIPSLLSLHLEENQLRQLPDSAFSGMPGLQELYLNHNRLRDISPGAFKGLGSLLRLHLNSNRLAAIDRRWFRDVPRLEVLMIGGNPVDVIQDLNFEPLGALRSLVLAGMGLRRLSERALEGLSSLESVSFYSNRLTKVPKEALRKVPGLKFLDLNKNPIQLVQRGDFRDMLHLKELGLNNMEELVSIEHSAVENLPELTKLEITNNPRLSYIHPRAFLRLPSMESLMLNSNALSALHRETVSSLPSLQEVSLHTNPIRCDCLARWVGAEAHRPVRFIEPQSTFCSDPPELKSRRVGEVSFREMAESCLPLIAPGTFPSRVRVRRGGGVALHCRALAEPEPIVFWVTPGGQRLSPAAAYEKYRVLAEGTLEIGEISAEEAGIYTCVAQNLVGADTRSVMVRVEGRQATPVRGAKRGNKGDLEVKEVKERHALLVWPTGRNTPSARLSWLVNGSREDRRRSVRILAGTRAFNLTRLRPAMLYRVCLHLGPNETSCIHLRTTDTRAPESPGNIAPATLLAAAALLLLVAAKAFQGAGLVVWQERDQGHDGKPPVPPFTTPPDAMYDSTPQQKQQQQQQSLGSQEASADSCSKEKSSPPHLQSV